MTNPLDLESLSELDEFTLRASTGRIGVRTGYATVFFFENGSEPSVRRRSLRMLDAHRAASEGRINHVQPPGAKTMRPLGPEETASALFTQHADTLSPDDMGGANLAGYASARDSGNATQHLARTLWKDSWSRWSAVTLTGPIVPALADPGETVARCIKTAEWLKPGHGTAGHALIPDFGFGTAGHGALAWPTLARYPGFDWPDAGIWSVRVRADEARSIRTIGWLTVLDDEFVERLGGPRTLEANLDPEVAVHRYPGGVVLQAGPVPQIGDRKRGEIPVAYQKVWQATETLHFTAFKPNRGLFGVPSPLSPGDASRDWVRRFD